VAKSLLDLAESLERKAKAVDAAASELAVKTAETIVADLAFATPVDTSQALSNWIVTLDAPSSDKVLPHYPGEGGSTRNASAQETINRAREVLRGKKPGQRIYITNSLPYIRRLNEGYSGQAPAGFVERSVLIGRKMKAKFQLKDK